MKSETQDGSTYIGDVLVGGREQSCFSGWDEIDPSDASDEQKDLLFG